MHHICSYIFYYNYETCYFLFYLGSHSNARKHWQNKSFDPEYHQNIKLNLHMMILYWDENYWEVIATAYMA